MDSRQRKSLEPLQPSIASGFISKGNGSKALRGHFRNNEGNAPLGLRWFLRFLSYCMWLCMESIMFIITLLKQHVHIAQRVMLCSRCRDHNLDFNWERKIVMLTRNFKYKNVFQRIVCPICHMKQRTKKKNFFCVQKYYQFSLKDQSKQSWMPGPSRFRK